LDDISEEKIRQFLRKAKYERRLEIDPDILVKEALERFLSYIKKAAKIVGFERQEVWEYPIPERCQNL